MGKSPTISKADIATKRSEPDDDIVFQDPVTRKLFRYKEHQFIGKEHSACIQAADILAWQWYIDRRRKSEGKPRRKDCEAIVNGKFSCLTFHATPETVEQAIVNHLKNGTLVRQLPPSDQGENSQ